MEKHTAVYICSGCGIGEALDMERLCTVAKTECAVPVCRTHPNLCGGEGRQLIRNDIDREGINALVVAACSPRVMADLFTFEGVVADRANLREQVVWGRPPNDEDTQMMAEDYLRMAVVKVVKMEPPVPFLPGGELSRVILVVGGGITGMTAALEGARAGCDVVLVEKEKELGGFRNRAGRQVVFPYREVTENDINELVESVYANGRITVYTEAAVEKITGGPCLFTAFIRRNGSTVQHPAGAVVMAAGWRPYDPSRLDAKLGYGLSPNVVTNVRFEELSRSGQITRPDGGGPVKNVAFLQCAGQRDPERLPYCSGVCCLTALKQAILVRRQDPEAGVFVVYTEMRSPGHGEDLFRLAQQEGVIFIRGESPEVVLRGNELTVEVHDDLLGDRVLLGSLDLVVLATGMVPAAAFGEEYKASPKPEGEKEEYEVPADAILVSGILNLDYRQGPELPGLQYGFPDSHYICFPYETRRTGIYAAGPVRQPMGISEAVEDAAGAVMKAVQCMELTSRGAAVHPRSGDLSHPEFFMQRCTQCKRCTVECPFGAINEDEKANPVPYPTRCRRCGVCMGACPERIITFGDYSVALIGDMIKSIEVPDEFEEKPRILVLACENDAYPALDMVGLRRMTFNPWVRVIPVRCLGSLNLVWVADALSKGIDGILLLGCRHGDDYQCHFMKGSELAGIRLSKVRETLERLVLESDRVRFEMIAITDYDKLPALLDGYAERLAEIGPNPYKSY